MKLDFLPKEILYSINKLNIDKLYEIRLRANFPIIIWYDFNKLYLSKDGVTQRKENALICNKEDIENIIYTVTEYSLYSVTDRLKDGYLTTNEGVRIGIAGECVFENNKIVTIKNFSSLCIRVPNNIVGCSKKLYELTLKDKLRNVLIIAPPKYGKTTLLKDLIHNFDKLINVLIIDERGEISNGIENADVIKYSDKNYAFQLAIRSLSPEVIITDELISDSDWNCVNRAVNSGIKIIATVHGKDVEEIKNKSEFTPNLFERYVVLESNGQAGKIKKIYDLNFNEC